jgi:CheY-like chemotaxis protein
MAMSPILLADDDADQAFLTTRAFKSAGVVNALVVVRDGSAAMDYLAGKGRYADRAANPLPCLMLLDQKLPGCSGLDVLQWVRTESPVCTLPVLLLSSSNFDGDVQAAYLLGANGYLVKPASFEEMLAMAKAIKEYWLNFNRAPSPQ